MIKFIKKFLHQKSFQLRHQKYVETFQSLLDGCSVIDVGVWSNFPEPNPSENWLEKQCGANGKIIAVGLDDMRQFRQKYPHVLCVQANGCALPFKNGAVDIAISNAVLEHVNQDGQENFVIEIARVSRLKSILAVPDRFCPLEIHSKIPFLHWFPFWRSAFRLLGKGYWGAKENLSTIFTKRSLGRLLRANAKNGVWSISRQRLWGIPVSLIATHKPGK